MVPASWRWPGCGAVASIADGFRVGSPPPLPAHGQNLFPRIRRNRADVVIAKVAVLVDSAQAEGVKLQVHPPGLPVAGFG